jgi:hypothetical protein
LRPAAEDYFMPAIVRCKLCGTDHPYRDDIEKQVCDNCEAPLKMDNTRVIIPKRETKQDDPLKGM